MKAKNPRITSAIYRIGLILIFSLTCIGDVSALALSSETSREATSPQTFGQLPPDLTRVITQTLHGDLAAPAKPDDGFTPFFQYRFTAEDGSEDDTFGLSVAIDGDTVLIGAPNSDFGASTQVGSAYVFSRGSTGWVLQQRLVAPSGQIYDSFGQSVALSGDIALIGAPGAAIDGRDDQGKAYVYVRSGGRWILEQSISSTDGLAEDHFGYSVALSGDTAVIGAYGFDVAHNQGAAYVFTRISGGWYMQQRLTASDGLAQDLFGWSVAVSGDTLLIGSPYADIGADEDQGAAYEFTRRSGTWTQSYKYTTGDADDYFGQSVALTAITQMIGAPGVTVAGHSDQGAAYISRLSGPFWLPLETLTASDGAAGDHFGSAVAVSGDTALVGAMYDTVGTQLEQGSAYIFTYAAGAWTQQFHMIANDGAAGDMFGSGVALSGGTVLIGAENHTVAEPDQGAAYIYSRILHADPAGICGGNSPCYSDLNKAVAAADGIVWIHPGIYTEQIHVERPVILSLQGDVTFSQNIWITAGSLRLNGHVLTLKNNAYLSPPQTLNGIVILNGLGVQTLDGYGIMEFSDLVIDNPGEVELKVDAVVNGTLTLQNGQLLLYTENLTLNGPVNRVNGSIEGGHHARAAWPEDVSSESVSQPGEFESISSGAVPLAPESVSALFQKIIYALGGSGMDFAGWSVALDGDVAMFGAPRRDVDGRENQGAVIVFHRSNGYWSYVQEITAEDGAANDEFGSAVSISGGEAIIGAPKASVDGHAGQGCAYIFSRGTTWEQTQKLCDSTSGSGGDNFGASVDIDGITALVGAPYDNIGANVDQGSAWVYERESGTWFDQGQLLAVDGASGDQLGRSVALYGDIALVGQPYDDFGVDSNRGTAIVFSRTGDTWSQQQQIFASDGLPNDHFGHSVALNGDTALIGAPDDMVGGIDGQGSVWVFIHQDSYWYKQQQITAPGGAALDHFGKTVAIENDIALVGAPDDNIGAYTNQGSAHLFRRSKGGWSHRQHIYNSTNTDGEDLYFGSSVDLADGRGLIGFYGDKVGSNSGQGSALLLTPTAYTDPTGACGGNTPCYENLQDALDDGSLEVLVYPGTYEQRAINYRPITLLMMGDVTLTDDLVFSDGNIMLPGFNLSFKRDVVLHSGAFLNNIGVLRFNGTTRQSLDGWSDLSVIRVTIDNPAGVVLRRDLRIAETLTLQNGALTVFAERIDADEQVVVNGSLVSGIPITTYGQVATNQNVAPGTYGHLIFNGGNKLLPGAMIVQGNINANTSFSHNNGTVTLAGNLTQYLLNSAARESESPETRPEADPRFTFANLVLNNPAGTGTNDHLRVIQTLTIQSGRLPLGSHNLTLGPNAAIAGTFSSDRMIVADGTGQLRKEYTAPGSFTFPVGDASGGDGRQYAPAMLNCTRLGTPGYIAVRLVDAVHPNSAGLANNLSRYWVVTAGGGLANFSCSTAFIYIPADVIGSEARLWGGKWDGSTWTGFDHPNTTTHSFSGVVTSFSHFTAGPQGPHPIYLPIVRKR